MLKLKVINNGDHAGLVWFPDPVAPIPDCRGFAIERSVTAGAAAPVKSWLHNFIGFQQTQSKPPAGSEWQWPIQRYLWWDYRVATGDVVSYRIVPVKGPDFQHLTLDETLATAWSPDETISGQDGSAVEAYFNRGIIAAQWVARALSDEADKQQGVGPGGRAKLMTAISEPANPLRKALGGLLLPKLIGLLTDAQTAGAKIFAALYELNDPEVIAALKAFGSNCNLILGNGAFKPPANDENAKTRAELRTDGNINLFDRLVSSPHFAHNKFIIFCDGSGAAASVWTGSTNTTETGLCTQANNGILIKNSAVADAYLQEWARLHQAGNGYPVGLISANSTIKSFAVSEGNGASDQVTVWFAPTDHGEDMEQARRLINRAKDGILFLNFNPGVFESDPAQWTLLQTILNRHAPVQNPYYDSSLYIRGVVNQEVPKLTEPNPVAALPADGEAGPPSTVELDPAAATMPVALFNGGQTAPLRLSADVLVPEAIRTRYGAWATELKGASNVMIHSKVVVLDPFGDHPVVITGSHNQGMKASRSNDDNMVIIEGNAALAQAYALNAIAIYQEYRWRHHVASNAAAAPAARWSGLEDNDSWQGGHLKADQAELDFWLGTIVVATAAP